MKRRKIPLINVRSKTLTSIFTFANISFFIFVGFLDSKELIFSCFPTISVSLFHQTFAFWVYIVQSWRINFIYLMNKQKLKSIKRFIKNVKTDTTTSTSRERKTNPRSLEGNGSSILNSAGESHFWEGIIEEQDDGEEIDKKFQKVEKKFYQKRIQISGKYMFLAIFFHILLMILLQIVLHLEGKIKKKPNGECAYGNLFLPFIMILSLTHVVIFSYYLFKIWKIKDNFKIRNQLYMIFLASIVSIMVLGGKGHFERTLMWQWPLVFVLTVQYLIDLGYPLWLSRKSYYLNKELHKNLDNENTIEKFKHILTDKNKSKYFLKFLQLDYSIENLLFYQAVTSFEKINPNKKSKKKKYCQQIIKNFVQVNARLEVNLSHSIRNSTIELAQKDPTNSSCFEEAKKKIFFLMYSGSYPTFIDSKQYYEMMIELDQINIEIGGEKDIQLDDLEGDEDKGGDDQNKNQSDNDSNKESEIETKNEKEINNGDDEEDHNQKQSKSSSKSMGGNETSSETSNSESDSD
ncbi:regulator of g protein signaling [Anaeramoeba flamelloides]|uniref:Regulator of g protein signaling n=1 Tax=Anaeramoeba flamelloides TaxID=1746091 RepID=A0ABQ8YPM8_9EUKA|nr:regulator of g protein signaling [Anaeramoeba flamelloides]